jgi:hypothetical protein
MSEVTRKVGTWPGCTWSSHPKVDKDYAKRWRQTLDGKFLRGGFNLVDLTNKKEAAAGKIAPQDLDENYSIITVWCHFAWSAFCLQWLAIGWAMVVGDEQ